MRSLLFVPGHDARKLAKGTRLRRRRADPRPGGLGARCRKGASTRRVRGFRRRASRAAAPFRARQRAVDGAHARRPRRCRSCATLRHHAAQMRSGRDVARVDAYICRRSRCATAFASARCAVLPIVTETARRHVRNGQLRARGGTAAVRHALGRRGSRRRHRRVGQSRRRAATRRLSSSRAACCLFGAAAAGVAAVDAVYTDFRDVDGLRAEARAAVRGRVRGQGGDSSRAGTNHQRSLHAQRRRIARSGRDRRTRSPSSRARERSASAGACSIARI